MSVRDRAIAGEQDALETLFGQFIPQGEQIVDCRYMGVLGVWGIGTHSFAAITPNRAASLKMSMLGGVLYQDGPLEYVNSSHSSRSSPCASLLRRALWSTVIDARLQPKRGANVRQTVGRLHLALQ